MEITLFPAAASVSNSRQVKAHVEIPVDIPAYPGANAGNRNAQTVFTGQRLVDSPGNVVEEQAAQVAFPRNQVAGQVGGIKFDICEIAGIADNFTFQKSANGIRSSDAELFA